MRSVKFLGGWAVLAAGAMAEETTKASSGGLVSGSVHTLIVLGVLGALGYLFYSVANDPR